MMLSHLANLRPRFLRRSRPVNLVRLDRNRRRAAFNAEAAPGRENRRAWKRSLVLLVAQLVDEIAIQSQRHRRRDAILLVLQKGVFDILARVTIHPVLRPNHKPEMPVPIDNSRHDRAAFEFDHARIFRIVDLAFLADGGDPVALNHKYAFLYWRRAGSVNQLRAFENDHRARLRTSHG